MSVPITKICLDLDGVMASFSQEAAARYGVPYPQATELPATWLDDSCADRTWSRCRGYAFWFNLPLLPWARDLRALVANHTDQWVYLTKPTNDPDCYGGKHDWINRHFGDARDRLWIVNGDKSLMCRGAGDLLVDDNGPNVERWRAAGGTTFHWTEITADYPQDLVDERLVRLKDVLEGRA